MSNVIDDRVVRMEFDNQRFEQNVSTSISTLDKLKAALKLDGASKGLESIENHARNFNMGGISSAIDTISGRFTALGVIGTTILQDIGHEAYKAGQKILSMINDMTLKQVAAGWDKYAEKTEAVQTIMAATNETWRADADAMTQIEKIASDLSVAPAQAQKDLEIWKAVQEGTMKASEAAKQYGITTKEYLDKTGEFGAYNYEAAAALKYEGSQMDYVNEQMAKLNWFTDETSYAFVDMVSNIGKFTANQIPLSQATTAMQGIATWAAISGQNAGAASRAMYNMAQAIGVGSVKLMDWKSIENANMATAGFKKEVLESAVALGVLQKSEEGVYTTTKGTEVSIESFSQTLSEGWFNKDVLLDVLDKYGSFTNELHDVAEASNLTATDILGLVEAQKQGKLTTEMLSEAMGDDCTMSIDELRKKVEELSTAENDLGYKAFKAAQEAKTFEDAINATKDAASTKWMNIFENIFGDYEKARHVWTDFANFLYDALVAPLETVQDLSEAFIDPLTAFGAQLNRITKASGLTKEELMALAQAEREGTLTQEQINEAAAKGKMKADELAEAVSRLADDAYGDFTDQLLETADATGISADKLLSLVQRQAQGVLKEEELAAAAKEAGLSMEEMGEVLDGLVEEGSITGLDRIRTGLKGITDLLFNGKGGAQRGILGSIREGIQRVIPPLDITKASIVSVLKKFEEWGDSLKLTGKQMSLLRQAGEGLGHILAYVGNTIKNFWDATSSLRESIKGLLSSISEFILKLFGSAKEMDTAGASAEGFQKICDKLAEIIDKVSAAIDKLNIDDLKQRFSGLSGVLKAVSDAFNWIIDKITNFDFSTAIGKAVDWIKEKFNILKEFLSTFDWGKAFKGLAGTGIVALIGTKLFKLFSNLESPLKAFDGLKDKVTDILDGIKGSLQAFQKGIAVDSIKKIAEAILILAAALLILGFVNYENAIKGIVVIGIILAALYAALQAIGKIDKAKLATLAVTMIAVAAAMLIFAVALGVLAGAVALFVLVAKMDGLSEGLNLMAETLILVVGAMFLLSKLSPKVLVAAAALAILAASLLILAAALAAFALVARMPGVEDGLTYMAETLLLVVGVLVLLGAVFQKNIGAILAASAALLVASAALLVLAAALGAFALIAKMSTAESGLTMLIAMLGALTIALLALGSSSPMVLAGAAALLVAAAACLVLAAAVAVVALALPLLAAGLAALGGAIGLALTSIGQGAQDFLVSLSDALVAVGDALAEIITTIAGSLGEAVSLLGEGIAEAIADIIASVGEGIGRGITAISDAIGTFGNNLTNAGLGITNFGDGVRSLKGIDWFGTAAGIADLAKSLKKLKPDDLATEMKPASEAIVTMCTEMITALENTMTSFEGAGQRIVNSFVSGINNAMGSISGAGTQIINSIVSAIMIAGEMGVTSQRAVSLGKLFGNGFVKGINEKLNKIRESGISVIDSLIGGAMSKNGEAEVAGGSLVQTITDAFSQAFQLLNGEGEGGGLQEAGAGMVASLIAGITASTEQVDASGQALGLALVTGFSNKQTDFETAATKMSTDAAGKINETQSSWSDAGEYLGQGLIAGINNMEGPVMEAASALAEKAAAAIRAALDINSPSRVTTRFGEYFGMGFINGISSQIGGAESVSSAMVNATVGALDQARSLISRILEDDFTPVITPVLDTSMIQGSLNSMSNLSVSAGVRNARSIGSVASLGQIQNGTPTPTTAVLSDSAIRALSTRQTTPNKTVIEFTGDLAQLARVLHPVIVDQYNYHGDKLIN